jgi:hypothetical protein
VGWATEGVSHCKGIVDFVRDGEIESADGSVGAVSGCKEGGDLVCL